MTGGGKSRGGRKEPTKVSKMHITNQTGAARATKDAKAAQLGAESATNLVQKAQQDAKSATQRGRKEPNTKVPKKHSQGGAERATKK